MLDTYRKDDAVIVVCQNNLVKTIEIMDANQKMVDLSGYPRESLIGSSLFILLSKELQDRLDEYVEYRDDPDTGDLGDVLGKVADITCITIGGEEVPCRLRMVRGESHDGNPWFNLVLHDITKLRRTEALHNALSEAFKGHEVIDQKTGLPDYNSMKKDVELAGYYSGQENITSCFALLVPDNCEGLKKQYGEEAVLNIHRQIGLLCRQQLRDYDVVGTLAPDTLGLLLVDIGHEPGKAALNRLRWAVSKASIDIGGENINITASIGFIRISVEDEVTDDLIESCQARFTQQMADKNNILIDLNNAG